MQYSAVAKFILVGEHAVVYGEPAIAYPLLSLRAFASVFYDVDVLTLEFSSGAPSIAYSSDSSDHPLLRLIDLILGYCRVSPPPLRIRVESMIPVASGLGSGAAVSVALGRALLGTLGAEMELDVLNSFVYEIEKYYHGSPSGIDNTVIVYERPVFYTRHQGLSSFPSPVELWFVVADTGRASLTRFSVEAVKQLYETSYKTTAPVIKRIGSIATEAREAISSGNIHQLGQLLNENHDLLRKLTVSSPELDVLTSTAREHGALGAKLSGGGRGGIMVALAENKQHAEAIAQALRANGAVATYITSFGGDSQ